jgi:OOP family OmpA-OmpF porin
MKMKHKQKPSQKLHIQMKYVWLIGGAVALTAIVFVGIFVFNFFGIQHKGAAKDLLQSRYPFDVSDPALQEVNFTILPIKVNSVFEEVRPFITADGKELFFCRRNHPGNVSKQKDKQDIWYCTSEGDNQWSETKDLGEPINTKNADAICSISPNGDEIFFISDIIDPKKPLMHATRQGTGWSEPVAMEIEDFYNLNAYIDFYCSVKPKVLLMAVQREDSKGDQDLYVSFPKGENKWSAPVSLGAVVNSTQADFAPFLSADGKTLFFSSYGHGGFGGCDIFETTRLDETWKKWSKPKNLGKGINSKREESYFSISGDYKYIYYESYDLEHEVRDIFRADLPLDVKPASYQASIQ